MIGANDYVLEISLKPNWNPGAGMNQGQGQRSLLHGIKDDLTLMSEFQFMIMWGFKT